MEKRVYNKSMNRIDQECSFKSLPHTEMDKFKEIPHMRDVIYATSEWVDVICLFSPYILYIMCVCVDNYGA